MTAPRRVVRTLREMAPGTIITAPFGDIEGNVAEKSSDGFWLVTGEDVLATDQDIADWAEDVTITVVRRGYRREGDDA